MTGLVNIEYRGRIAVLILENPPVNAASRALRSALCDAIGGVCADGAADAIVLSGAGRNFVAGADISEFGKPALPPLLTDVATTIENCSLPVIAAVHGATLGGGLEIALACHRRVALTDATLGFPEVTLGIIPGAGGTQRAPRLVGVKAALDLILSGRPVSAQQALDIGLVDVLAEGSDPVRAGVAEARSVLAGSVGTRVTGRLITAPDQASVNSARRDLEQRTQKLFAPLRCVDAVECATLPLDDGLRRERALFLDCMESPERAGLVHAFFAERAVAKIPERDTAPRPIESVGVVGGGTMGAGIATSFLLAGLDVTLIERDQAAADSARARIAFNLDGAVARGKLTVDDRRTALDDRFAARSDMAALGDADLVVEAVFEDLAVKRDVFATLDRVCKPDAVLATNTSYLDVGAIAAATGRPHDVVGLHFFTPAHVMRLVEVVVPAATAPDVVATAFAVAKRLRKVAVRSGVCEGFIGNRIYSHFRKAAEYLVLDGAAPEQVDGALEAFGFAMGPFKVADLAGLQISWATRKRLAPTRDPRERYSTIADRMCEREWFGRRSGRGYYLYAEGAAPTVNPDLPALIATARESAGVVARQFDDAAIVRRCMTAIVAEAARVVEEGIALRPVDVDAVLLLGYGFPRHHGGPLHYADHIGLDQLLADTVEFAAEDAFYWKTPKLLETLVSDRRRFADLNEPDA